MKIEPLGKPTVTRRAGYGDWHVQQAYEVEGYRRPLMATARVKAKDLRHALGSKTLAVPDAIIEETAILLAQGELARIIQHWREKKGDES